MSSVIIDDNVDNEMPLCEDNGMPLSDFDCNIGRIAPLFYNWRKQEVVVVYENEYAQ